MMFEYEIRGKYPGMPWEEIDSADSREEAHRLLSEYKMCYESCWQFKIVRKRVNAA